MKKAKTWWSVQDVMREANLPRREVRALWLTGIVDPPGRGRGAGFDATNHARLLAAVAAMRQGYSGPALKARFASSDKAALTPAASKQLSTWLRIEIAPGVEVHIDLTRADTSKADALAKKLMAVLST